MKCTHVYQKGNGPINEDSYVINQDANVYAVIDGATGLDGLPGYLASYTVQEQLQALKQTDGLYNGVLRANQTLGQKLVDQFNNFARSGSNISSIQDIPKKQRSSTGLAAIQLHSNGHALDFFHAGDCMIFVEYKSGEIRAITYDLIQYFDQLALKEFMKLHEKKGNHMDLSQLREMIKPILMQNRENMNTSGGYGVIDGTAEAFQFMESGTVSLSKVSKIVLLTDGMLLPTREQTTIAWEKSAKIACNQGVEALFNEVVKRESQDASCLTYPRLKESDDKTALLLER
ncbi:MULTISPECIES: protein phosphatase 2C domain-containing protein [Virgibacillus]|uniref:Protein phosphatase 2C domain-containing protein n=1 Tax=Virgibacillus massiliensis TaxID=1462526 RepID=A0A024Q8Q4_9BACI|nr:MULTISPECIES: protein phosphatase 2C domain-containing protein [Virgibacillus]CDQ38662.1 hypothetical protein BN990_00934 [Virgibacillus massiliensis]